MAGDDHGHGDCYFPLKRERIRIVSGNQRPLSLKLVNPCSPKSRHAYPFAVSRFRQSITSMLRTEVYNFCASSCASVELHCYTVTDNLNVNTAIQARRHSQCRNFNRRISYRGNSVLCEEYTDITLTALMRSLYFKYYLPRPLVSMGFISCVKRMFAVRYTAAFEYSYQEHAYTLQGSRVLLTHT